MSSSIDRGSQLAVLHHRTIASRRVPVVADAHPSVASPACLADSWHVPCDIVGMHSKKAKMFKIRFHPSVFEMASAEKELIHEMHRAAQHLLSVMFTDSSSEWSLDPCESPDALLRRLSRFFTAAAPHIVFNSDRLTVAWPYHATASASIDATVAACLRARVDQSKGMDQELAIEYRKANMSRTLWRLRLDNGYLAVGSGCDIQVGPRGVHIWVSRSVPAAPSAPPMLPSRLAHVDHNGEHAITMMHSQQHRVEDLRRRLEHSVSSFQKSATTKDSQHHPRTLILVAGESETVVQICQFGSRPRVRCAASTPLKVIVGEGNAGGCQFASSPAESDSGVSLASPTISPLPNKASPFYQYSEESSATAKLLTGMRQRSHSESGYNGRMIKGILKKPNHARAIGGFTRSLSESEDEREPPLTRSFDAFENTIEESNEECDEEPAPLAPRAKRVSFSENIQRRSFRPNSSILGQKKKNERRQKNRDKRRERAMSEGDDRQRQTDESEQENESKPGLRDNRKDSGFVDDDGVKDDPEECERGWLKLVRAQRQKWSSVSN